MADSDAVFPTTPILRLEHCVLRPYHVSDLEPMCAAANDPDIVRYMRDTFPYPYDREAGLNWLKICKAEGLPEEDEPASAAPASTAASKPEVPRPELTAAICLLDGTFVGSTGLHVVGRDGTERYTRELGYWIGKAHWGRGLATEVAAGLGRWALSAASGILTPDGQPLRRVEAGVYGENAASVKVLERAGYVREGVRRQAVVKNGTMQDVVIFGLLASDLKK
ncbi:hypothetical protein HMPREF1624_06160 [Sporothrix schenckii ATCC 58251]|uniref:N-acetyltransferase domain-containing protein n=1 Tax=Sporothrix schenckii (strain ATCC 58251 / de Perez 2211183) TaxID=1391915 RepID=U7PQY2_SPOS1|nr:hypothetical protein HMPREF1624_06160 [Sporothrix schenckii ATCC 58251]